MDKNNANREIVKKLKKEINHLRTFAYLFVSISFLLTLLMLFWFEQSSIETFYSEAPKIPKAALYLSPKEGHYKVGESFLVDILVNTAGSNVVGVAAYLSYKKDKMDVVSVDLSNSAFDITFDKKNDSSNGKIKIALAKPTPGVNGNAIKIGTIRFKAKGKNNLPIENIYFDFTTKSSLYSAVILDDKKGTNILNTIQGAKIFIN